MDYRPALPEHNDNVSKEHPLKDFAILLSGLVFLGLLVFFVLGLMVDIVVKRISPETESKWFYDSLLSKQVTQSIADTETLQAFEFEKFDDLKRCAEIDVPLTLFLSQSEQVNAVAIPGGNIIIYEGLIDKLQTENGLAFVLAHELAHFKHRDHLRAMGRGIVFITASTILTGSQSSLTHLVGSLTNMQFASYSQDRESDADVAALVILSCAYGHVAGADEFFRSAEGDTSDFSLTHYFSSHPEAQQRIDDIERLILNNGYTLADTVPLQKKTNTSSEQGDVE